MKSRRSPSSESEVTPRKRAAMAVSKMIGDREAVEALEIAEVVVGGVQDLDHARVGEEGPERLERRQRERIHEMTPPGVVGYLDEAELDRVVMQAVGLGVDARAPWPP